LPHGPFFVLEDFEFCVVVGGQQITQLFVVKFDKGAFDRAFGVFEFVE
jgi:hypothetical protein